MRNLRMRAFTLCCNLCLCLVSACTVKVAAEERTAGSETLGAAKTSSQTRFVKFERANVHCGPAQHFYVTSALSRGASVEVFHQTQDGWCGIRPPEGSHDWLAADRAYLLPGGKQAEIVDQKTPAWIGSELQPKEGRFRWQIELQPTQKVVVIGEIQQAIDSDETRLWYKILPPPGEFRWIRQEALSSTPLQAREVTTASSIGRSGMAQSQNAAEVATYQEVIERQPVAGEYIEGEGIVIGSQPGSIPSEPWNSDEGYVNGGVVSDEGYLIDDSSAMMPMEEGVVVDGELAPCPGCHRAGCTTCEETHQTDSFRQWEAAQASGNPKLRFRPIGRILGLVGLSVVEGERVQDASGPLCPTGCGCARCLRHRADLHPRTSGRFDHLPRPSRRLPGQFPHDWLGMREPLMDPLASTVTNPDTGGRSLLEPSPASPGNWHGLASARLGTDLGTIGGGSADGFAVRTPMNAQSVIPAAAQEELHFSTPEIRQAMVELSRTVSDSTDRWDLRQHAVRAQQWIDQSTDPIVRGEARLLLERIENFELIRRRSMSGPETAYALPSPQSIPSSSGVPASLAGFQRPVDLAANPPAANDPFPASPAGVQRNPDGTPASDASGWLVQVHSAEFGQPEYALTDDHGGLIAYVQPAPGMNLSRYLKQPVGIYGVKGYLPNLSARQIVAERIVRLR